MLQHTGREYLLANVDSKDVGRAVMKVIDSLQHLSTPLQVAALSVAFSQAVDRYGVDKAEALLISDNIMKRGDEKELRASMEYMKHEWK